MTNHTAKVIFDLLRPDPEADAHWLELARAVGSACAITGCMNILHSQGLCDTHYRKHRQVVANDAHLVNAPYRASA